jgi:hypothetical protein
MDLSYNRNGMLLPLQVRHSLQIQKIHKYIHEIRRMRHLSLSNLEDIYHFDNTGKNIIITEYNHTIQIISELLENLLEIQRAVSETRCFTQNL